jgi:hypothetical protein
MRKKFLLLGMIFLLSACSLYRIESEDLSTNYYPRKESSQDVIYLERLDRPAEVIGYVTVNTERNRTLEDVIEQMRHEAAELGGDAITEITVGAPGSWKRMPIQQWLGNAYVRANFTAKVVIFQ